MPHVYSVDYYLTDEQAARLEALTVRFNLVMHTKNTPASLFPALMSEKCFTEINQRPDDLDRTLLSVEARQGGFCDGCGE